MARKKDARTPDNRSRFLKSLTAGSTVADAAKAAGIARETAYKWRKAEPAFADEWDAAYAQGADALYTEAHRRAVEGAEEPVFHQGAVVGHVRRYSDTLLMFLMKSRDPERYCDRMRAASKLRSWAKSDAQSSGNASVPETVIALLTRLESQKAALAESALG